METLDESELPKPKSSFHPLVVSISANLIIMLVVSLLIKYFGSDDKVQRLIGFASWIALQMVICLIAGVIILITNAKNRQIGIGFILSAFAVLLIGFGTCIGIYHE